MAISKDNGFTFQAIVGQLEPIRGSYYYIRITSDQLEIFPQESRKRLIVNLEDRVSFSCGFNHMGDGSFFIIISSKRLQLSGKTIGDTISVSIKPDPNPLGVEIPEALEALLEQDSGFKEVFDSLTDGKKRSLIFGINKIKNIDLQISKIKDLLQKPGKIGKKPGA